MEVRLAKTAGFCFGVKRAVDKVYESAKGDRKIYTYGPIIHNKEVVKDLETKGVKTINSEDELDMVGDGIVIIRSHGVAKSLYDLLEQKKIEYIDMTCPFVLRIHDIVEKESAKGNHIVITGSPGHPEVQGICGWCHNTPTVIENKEEAEKYIVTDDKKVVVVSQTTFNYDKFQEFVEIFGKMGYDVNVVNTICDATQKRQQEAKEIAKTVDTMIVIGDRASSNSRKLYDICSKECADTYFIQTLSELDIKGENAETFGITAGASTPNNIIEEVQNYVRANF